MVAWHDQNGNCFHRNMLLGDNTYKSLKETYFQIMLENIVIINISVSLEKSRLGDYKALYEKAPPPYPYAYLYFKKGAPFK